MKNWDWLVPVSDSGTKVGSSSLFLTMHQRGKGFLVLTSYSGTGGGARLCLIVQHRHHEGGNFSDSALEGEVICLCF
jgi:hypothetical protein